MKITAGRKNAGLTKQVKSDRRGSKERAALFCKERAAEERRFPMTARGKNTVEIALKHEASTGIDKEL